MGIEILNFKAKNRGCGERTVKMNEIAADGKNTRIIEADSFDLRETLDCGQAFRFRETDDGSFEGVALGRMLRVYKDGNDIVFKGIEKAEFMSKFYRYFTLDIDYNEVKNRLSEDKYLAEAIKAHGGIRLLRQDKWECLCSFIISQNNNIPRIKGIIERLCELFGERCDGGFAFPSAQRIAALSAEDLAPIRAGFRAKYIIDAARKTANSEIDFAALDTAVLDEARAELMKIKGVGPKVADCALLFSCGRFEAFPRDVWIKRVAERLYPNGLPECFGEYAGIAQQYLFYHIRSGGFSQV